MENLKLVHQLFIGKVADEIGDKRAMKFKPQTLTLARFKLAANDGYKIKRSDPFSGLIL